MLDGVSWSNVGDGFGAEEGIDGGEVLGVIDVKADGAALLLVGIGGALGGSRDHLLLSVSAWCVRDITELSSSSSTRG